MWLANFFGIKVSCMDRLPLVHMHSCICSSVVLVPQNHFSLVLVLVLHFEISISSSIPSSQ